MIEIERTTPAVKPLIELPTQAPAALSPDMQALAQGYVDARTRAGYAWLDMGRFLTEARAAAKYGEWNLFLAATNTSEDWAKRLIAIYAQSQQSRTFADAMRTNFLSVATGYELISAPPDVQDRLLSRDAPPTVKQIREEKREATNPAPSPTLDAAPDLSDIILRLDAHGYAKTTTRQKGITTFYSFRDYRSNPEESAGEVELAEGELPYWLAELDDNARRAAERQAQYLDMKARFAVLRYDLRRDGTTFSLYKPEGGLYATAPLDAHARTLATFEAGAAKRAAANPANPTAPEISDAPPTLSELDALGMPVDLHNAGFYWDSATPPTVAQNGSAWRGQAPTVEGALMLARLHKDARTKPVAIFSEMNHMECKALIRESALFLKAGGDRRFPTIWQALSAATARAMEVTGIK